MRRRSLAVEKCHMRKQRGPNCSSPVYLAVRFATHTLKKPTSPSLQIVLKIERLSEIVIIIFYVQVHNFLGLGE